MRRAVQARGPRADSPRTTPMTTSSGAWQGHPETLLVAARDERYIAITVIATVPTDAPPDHTAPSTASTAATTHTNTIPLLMSPPRQW